jgi:SAM-dependent methyltransferase
MDCYLCGSARSETVPGRVRDRPEIPILRCADCGLVFLGSRDHIHDEYYESDYTLANHGQQEWRESLNCTKRDDERRFRELEPYLRNRRYLDIGCGAGGTLLLARGTASKVFGVEPQLRWRDCLKGEGVLVVAAIDDVADRSQDIVSLFHVLEHVADPIPFLRVIQSKVADGGRIVIEVPSADDVLLTLYRSKAFSEFTYWSPHLFLYTAKTLGALLERAGIQRGRYVIQQFQRYPLSNHLMWLAEGKAGGHEKWAFLDSEALTSEYAAQLARIGKCDTLVATVEISDR